MAGKGYRIERDSMGELRVPDHALWGAQTQRAVDNFPVSGLPMPRGFIRALGLIKWAAAGANAELGLLKSGKSFLRSLGRCHLHARIFQDRAHERAHRSFILKNQDPHQDLPASEC